MQITYSLIHTFTNIVITLTILLAVLLGVSSIRKSLYRLINNKRLKNIISLQNQYTYSIMYICYVILMVGLIDAAWMYYDSSYKASYSVAKPSQMILQSYQAVHNASTQISQKQKDQYISEYKRYRDNYILQRNLMFSLFAILVWFFFWKLCNIYMRIAQCQIMFQTKSNQNRDQQMYHDQKGMLSKQNNYQIKSTIQQIQKPQNKKQQESLIKKIQKSSKQKENQIAINSSKSI